MDHILSDGVIS